jgi:hypothetical protein
VAGRVLELGRPLTVELGDRALIAQLNQDQYRRFNRGLYAVVLSYTEVNTDIAEVFPRDLGERRSVQHNVVTESVQLGLVPLPQPLPQQQPLTIRAHLIREYLGDGQAAGVIPEDAVALGVLAIREDRPEWLDTALLRHPLRPAATPGALQADLARHYEILLRDVMNYRRAGSLGDDFAAAEYFKLLPPAGSLPKGAIDPMRGRQGFFPEAFHVWTAPIRLADVELVRQESMLLPPIDLSLDEPVDVIVLAPLPNRDYGYFAQRLERAFDPESRRLPHLDLLRLRLYPRRPVHELDTDEATWQAIWDRVPAESLLYIRRPTRAAETAVSGIVLAQGAALPEPTEPAEPTPADAGGLLQDEDAVLLNRVNVERLGALRPPTDAAGETALAQIGTEFGSDAAAVQGCLHLLLRIERHYDALIWQTLLSLARAEALPAFLEQLTAAQQPGVATGDAVASAGAGFGLDSTLLGDWQTLATA